MPLPVRREQACAQFLLGTRGICATEQIFTRQELMSMPWSGFLRPSRALEEWREFLASHMGAGGEQCVWLLPVIFVVFPRWEVSVN